MEWVRKKHIFTAKEQHPLMQSHAQIPAPYKLHDEVFRIYFSSRDSLGRTYPYYLDYDFAIDKILHIETTPLWRHGPLGTFDDSGVMPASIVHFEDCLYLYYIGWNVRRSVPYHLSIGLAVSADNGLTFEKCAGPVMDRGFDEPFFNTAPCVMADCGRLRMWYVSATGWREIDGRMEPVYRVRHAESQDGLCWKRDAGPVIDYRFDGEAIGRPWVMKSGAGYRMWYSTRGSLQYRQPTGETYVIGYADSPDGAVWTRKDDQVGIGKAASGWDSEMIEYCSVIDLPGREIMLYNGNMFGLTGFGYAERLKP